MLLILKILFLFWMDTLIQTFMLPPNEVLRCLNEILPKHLILLPSHYKKHQNHKNIMCSCRKRMTSFKIIKSCPSFLSPRSFECLYAKWVSWGVAAAPRTGHYTIKWGPCFNPEDTLRLSRHNRKPRAQEEWFLSYKIKSQGSCPCLVQRRRTTDGLG